VTASQISKALRKLSFYGQVWLPWTPEDRYAFLTEFWRRLDVIVRPNGHSEGEISVYIPYEGELHWYASYYHQPGEWKLSTTSVDVTAFDHLNIQVSRALGLEDKYQVDNNMMLYINYEWITPDKPRDPAQQAHQDGFVEAFARPARKDVKDERNAVDEQLKPPH
jgi:hypothetical protein